MLSEHVYRVTVAFKMTERVEQRICIKFCIKLEYSSAETIQMIQKALRDDAMSAVQIKCGTNASKVVKNLMKVIHILEGLQQAGHLRMLNVYGLHQQRSVTDSVRTRS